MKKPNLLISFSGGETSAYMTKYLLESCRDQFGEVAVVFANTGQENEETLQFVDRCDKAFGFQVVWVEAVTVPGKREATKHRVVDFESASRVGEPFELVIEKYGIPNKVWPHCTRELKLNPIRSCMSHMGWEDYKTAIGIRSDEIDRMQADAKEKGLIYPLVKMRMTKPKINEFWKAMPFRLNLKGYQGNCKWCWKKSLRKHLTILTENPDWYDFPERMEAEHGMSGHNEDGKNRVFFREGRSVQDLKALQRKGGFTPADDDSLTMPHPELDLSGGCSESCEVEF